jgi:hypothetical protein
LKLLICTTAEDNSASRGQDNTRSFCSIDSDDETTEPGSSKWNLVKLSDQHNQVTRKAYKLILTSIEDIQRWTLLNFQSTTVSNWITSTLERIYPRSFLGVSTINTVPDKKDCDIVINTPTVLPTANWEKINYLTNPIDTHIQQGPTNTYTSAHSQAYWESGLE